MKNKTRRGISLLITLVMLTSFITISAAPREDGLTVSTSIIKVNGEVQRADEKPNAPLLRNGTTFLCADTMSIMFNREAYWVPERGTLYFGDLLETRASLEIVDANYTEVIIVADGSLVYAVDVAGNPADAFILDGIIYMPLRAVSVALGKSIEWNAAENMIIIDSSFDEDAALIEGEFEIIAGDQRYVITMQDLFDIGIEEFYAVIRGERIDYEGVSFAAVMDFLGLDASAATGMVIFSARDGHSTGGTVEEVFDPTNGFVVIAENGVPLGHWEDGGRGPFMVVFAHDVFAQRFLRYLTEVVIDMPQPTEG